MTKQTREAVFPSLTVISGGLIVTSGAESDSPGSPFMPWNPGGPRSPLTPGRPGSPMSPLNP